MHSNYFVPRLRCHPEVTSDQTIPDESDPWSDHSHPELTSDQTIPIRKWPMIRPFPSASDLWSDHSHPEPKPRPCNYDLRTHRVRWTSDDQRSLTSGWHLNLGLLLIFNAMSDLNFSCLFSLSLVFLHLESWFIKSLFQTVFHGPQFVHVVNILIYISSELLK